MGVKFDIGQRAVVNNSYDPYAPEDWREAAIGMTGYVSGIEDDHPECLWFMPDVPTPLVRSTFGQWAVLDVELDPLEG